MLRTLAIGVALSAALASTAAAQTIARADSSAHSAMLPTVTVTAKSAQPNALSRAWRMNEDRAQVLAMMEENRRLAAQLRGYDKQIVGLEEKLTVAKAEHDQKTAVIATTDSLTAETRRRRMELEARLRQLEGTPTVAKATQDAPLPEKR